MTCGGSGGMAEISATNVTFAILRIEKCVLIIMEIVLCTYFLRTFYGLLQICSQKVRGK